MAQMANQREITINRIKVMTDHTFMNGLAVLESTRAAIIRLGRGKETL